MRFTRIAVMLALGLAACQSEAPEPEPSETVYAGVPPDIAARTRALGQTMDPAVGYSPWDGAFTPTFWNGMTIHRAVEYSEDPAHLLDLYLPDESNGAARPVLLFVHGGGFRAGSRSGMPYPDNVPGWAVRQGMIGVSIDYRLAPDHPWPAGAAAPAGIGTSSRGVRWCQPMRNAPASMRT